MRNFLLTVLIIIVFTIIFINIYPPFGRKSSKEKQKQYAEKVDYYYDNKFHNKEDFKLISKVEGRRMIKDKFKSYNDKKPKERIPVVKVKELPKADLDDIKIIWFGHSTSLLQINGMNILIDPVLCAFRG